MHVELTFANIKAQCRPPAFDEVNGKGNPMRQRIYWDTKCRGLGMVVGRQPANTEMLPARTWVFQADDPTGRTIRTKLGRFPDLTPKQANAQAKIAAGRIAEGINPNHRGESAAGIIDDAEGGSDWDTFTLAQAIERHIASMRKKKCAARSIECVTEELERHLGDWMNKPISLVRRKHCVERHEYLTEKAGPTQANRTMAMFRAVWNSAAIHLEVADDRPNPVGKQFGWNAQRKRQPIKWNDLPAWANKVNGLNNPVRRDFNWFVLFTGLRSEDARTIRWEDVNLVRGTLHRPRPKGGEDRKFDVHLSDEALAILQRRREENVLWFGSATDWAFPTRDRHRRIIHMRDPKEQDYARDETGKIARDEAGRVHKVPYLPGPHTLRHTFASAATSAGVGFLHVKALLNHIPNDVTADYAKPDESSLRDAANLTARYLLERAQTQPAVDGPAGRIEPESEAVLAAAG